jgi:hypothetical protein
MIILILRYKQENFQHKREVSVSIFGGKDFKDVKTALVIEFEIKQGVKSLNF